MFKTVLFPINKSQETLAATEVVMDIVKTYGSHLMLLSVLENEVTEEDGSRDPMTSHEQIAELLNKVQSGFSKNGIEAQILERQGNPAFTICDVADEMDVKLIIMGSRGVGLTEEGPKDSITNQVINLSPCPVLIIP
ncbi:universal stress protein [Roseofilum reptotaenium CS-1145]|uniref:Universal stress protein n=1 Tax=Roseofilum reptotaenium AO1-A TaxID=1925591 RepID=A0A1L9QW53_9CYAN|nr:MULTISPECIES: universal stress protein [Roseofilum]MBP0028597.1 universal stress protein [Roseofilum sp. Guam]MDB9518061.1 universal stress protein [Roseofilum reptotaenium CS-1145]OJJ26856.1 universal stress protein [Roseofilum reptotaenium AO1-A]